MGDVWQKTTTPCNKHGKNRKQPSGSRGGNKTEREMEAKKTGLQRLREPFPEHQISLLPKPYKRDSQKGNCNVCGGYHGLPAVHLSYVGHAALTDRLLECDESWSWEPVAFGPDGLPLLDRDGGMWIRLTVCGVTRLGYGDAQGKTGPDAMKERIGDALRNAAMRFGAALDLWHKGDLHKAQNEEDEPPKKNVMSEDDLGRYKEEVRKSPSIVELKSRFAKAYSAAKAIGDKEAIDILTDVKEERKTELEAIPA